MSSLSVSRIACARPRTGAVGAGGAGRCDAGGDRCSRVDRGSASPLCREAVSVSAQSQKQKNKPASSKRNCSDDGGREIANRSAQKCTRQKSKRQKARNPRVSCSGFTLASLVRRTKTAHPIPSPNAPTSRSDGEKKKSLKKKEKKAKKAKIISPNSQSESPAFSPQPMRSQSIRLPTPPPAFQNEQGTGPRRETKRQKIKNGRVGRASSGGFTFKQSHRGKVNTPSSNFEPRKRSTDRAHYQAAAAVAIAAGEALRKNLSR